MNVLMDYKTLDNLAKVIEFGLFLHLKRGCVESDFEEELIDSFKAAQELLALVKEQTDHRVFFSIETDDVQFVVEHHLDNRIDVNELDFDQLDREINAWGCNWQDMVQSAIESILEHE